MKKRQQVIYNWSIIILNVALFFIPSTFEKLTNGYGRHWVEYYSTFTWLQSLINAVSYKGLAHVYSTTPFAMIFSFVYTIGYTILCVVSIVTLFIKSNVKFLHILPMIFNAIICVILCAMSGVLPFVGFAISTLVVVAYIAYLVYVINQKTNFISKLKNYKRKPTNKERIAQLEKELQAIKDNQNRNA